MLGSIELYIFVDIIVYMYLQDSYLKYTSIIKPEIKVHES